MKLVRDYILEIIEADGKWCIARRALSTEEHMAMLGEKIVEESREFIENPSYEEAADMLEVIKAFCYLNKLEWDAVLAAAENKQETHGGFYNGIILQRVGEN